MAPSDSHPGTLFQAIYADFVYLLFAISFPVRNSLIGFRVRMISVVRVYLIQHQPGHALRPPKVLGGATRSKSYLTHRPLL